MEGHNEEKNFVCGKYANAFKRKDVQQRHKNNNRWEVEQSERGMGRLEVKKQIEL